MEEDWRFGACGSGYGLPAVPVAELEAGSWQPA